MMSTFLCNLVLTDVKQMTNNTNRSNYIILSYVNDSTQIISKS